MELFFYEHSFSFRLFLISLKNVYEGKSWDHLWFIYMLIGLYIVTPLLRILICHANEKEIKYLLFVLFIFTCLIPFLNFLTGTKCGIWIPVSSIYLLYYIIGYALHNDIIRIPLPICFSLLIIGILCCFLSQFIPNMLILTDTGFQFELTSQDSITGFIISISIFSLAKNSCSNTINWMDTKIAPLSFGVYIIHMFFMNILFKVFHFTPEYYNTYLVWVMFFFITLIASLITTFLLRKIRFIRKWLL